MYTRKTRDVITIDGMYYGEWSEETTAENYADARRLLKEYRENCPNTAFRIRTHREYKEVIA